MKKELFLKIPSNDEVLRSILLCRDRERLLKEYVPKYYGEFIWAAAYAVDKRMQGRKALHTLTVLGHLIIMGMNANVEEKQKGKQKQRKVKQIWAFNTHPGANLVLKPVFGWQWKARIRWDEFLDRSFGDDDGTPGLQLVKDNATRVGLSVAQWQRRLEFGMVCKSYIATKDNLQRDARSSALMISHLTRQVPSSRSKL